jgi:nitrate/TMAO reductase-like tetraheme cytochrome c subunit
MRFGIGKLAIVAAVLVAVLSLGAQNRDRFSHATGAHKRLDCGSCHKMPTANWVSARGYPDVADFPGHASCINCHRREFFAGNRPAICAGCHVNPGPRGAARFPFPVPSRSQEFSTIFPHNIHQDVIAKRVDDGEIVVAHFVKASFSITRDDPPQFNNCAICHETTKALPKTVDRIPIGLQPLGQAGVDAFVPKPSFFKDKPDGHASCFTCHYQGVKPAAASCAGCHSLTPPYFERQEIARYSLKFDHQQKEHSVRDCMTCHLRISQNADVRTLKDADVPFIACVQCHGDKISEELAKRAETTAAKQPAYQCSYCHTTAVGRFPVPTSHEQR